MTSATGSDSVLQLLDAEGWWGKQWKSIQGPTNEMRVSKHSTLRFFQIPSWEARTTKGPPHNCWHFRKRVLVFNQHV